MAQIEDAPQPSFSGPPRHLFEVGTRSNLAALHPAEEVRALKLVGVFEQIANLIRPKYMGQS